MVTHKRLTDISKAQREELEMLRYAQTGIPVRHTIAYQCIWGISLCLSAQSISPGDLLHVGLRWSA